MSGDAHQFSDKSRAILLSAGWTPGRRTDIEEALHRSESGGRSVFEVARRFLEEFDRLEFECRGVIGPTITRTCRIDVDECSWIDDVGVRQWEDGLGQRLCPVGRFLGNEGFHVLVGGNGQIYVALIDTLLLAGETVDEGLDVLCSGGVLRVPSPYRDGTQNQ